MESKKQYVIVIDMNTRLGKKDFVQGQIHGIISALVCNIEGVEPQDVFTYPDLVSKSCMMTLYIYCSQETFKLITHHINKHYPHVCLAGEHDDILHHTLKRL